MSDVLRELQLAVEYAASRDSRITLDLVRDGIRVRMLRSIPMRSEVQKIARIVSWEELQCSKVGCICC